MTEKIFIGSGLAALLLLLPSFTMQGQPPQTIEAPGQSCTKQGQPGAVRKEDGSKPERGRTMNNVRDFGKKNRLNGKITE